MASKPYSESASQAMYTSAAPTLMRSASTAPKGGGGGSSSGDTDGSAGGGEDESGATEDPSATDPQKQQRQQQAQKARKNPAGRITAADTPLSERPWVTWQRTEPITVNIDTIPDWPVTYGLFWEATDVHSWPRRGLRFDVERSDKSNSAANSLLRGDVSVYVSRRSKGSGELSSTFVGQSRVHKTMKTHNIAHFELGDEELVTCKRTVKYTPDPKRGRQRDSYELSLTNMSQDQTFLLRVTERFNSPQITLVEDETSPEIVRNKLVDKTMLHANMPVENTVKEFVVAVPPGSKELKYTIEYLT